MPSNELEELEKNLNLTSSPSIVFNRNLALLHHVPSSFCFFVTAKEAMSYINFKHREKNLIDYEKTPSTKNSGGISHLPEQLKVKVAKEWMSKAVDDEGKPIAVLEMESDWTFSTPYKVGSFQAGESSRSLRIDEKL